MGALRKRTRIHRDFHLSFRKHRPEIMHYILVQNSLFSRANSLFFRKNSLFC
jgi:hypothetical protein